jgi:hypothetical protein
LQSHCSQLEPIAEALFQGEFSARSELYCPTHEAFEAPRAALCNKNAGLVALAGAEILAQPGLFIFDALAARPDLTA